MRAIRLANMRFSPGREIADLVGENIKSPEKINSTIAKIIDHLLDWYLALVFFNDGVEGVFVILISLFVH